VGIPTVDVGHNITHHKQYQFDKKKSWSFGNDAVYGYKIKTEGSGIFPAFFCFMGDEVEGSAEDLIIRVEDVPIKMTCVVPEHEGHQIRPVFR
jgi:hypothetical protein